MTNKDILRCMALNLPVKNGLREYKRVMEYSINADESGAISNSVGVIDESGTIRQVDPANLTTDAVLPSGLPKIVWDGIIPIEQAIEAMKNHVPASDGRFCYDRIEAIKMIASQFNRPLHYAVLLLDANKNKVLIPSKSLVIS